MLLGVQEADVYDLIIDYHYLNISGFTVFNLSQFVCLSVFFVMAYAFFFGFHYFTVTKIA